MHTVTKLTNCRVCNSTDLTHLFSLGTQIVSDFPSEDQVGKGIKCPISLCLCNQCTLVQQEYTAPQDFMYTRHYWYHSGTTETMRNALAELVANVVTSIPPLEKGDVVLDIGANDGTLLSNYSNHVFKVAVEPATNMREMCKEHCDIFIGNFWSERVYAANMMFEDGYKKAKIITAIGMFYDLDNPSQFIADIAKVLHPDGVFIAQLMCLKQTVQLGDVGNLAHEHLEFYSLMSLHHLLYTNGLYIDDIQENNVNGGSYRLFIRHKNPSVDKPRKYDGVKASRVASAFRKERDMKLDNPETYQEWFRKAEENKQKVVDFIEEQIETYGKRIIVYGASTKGNVLLQYYGVGQYIYAAVDKSAEKVGRYTCDGIKIISEVEARELGCDFYFILPYSFREEFLAKESEFRKSGGQFIFPLPEFEVV